MVSGSDSDSRAAAPSTRSPLTLVSVRASALASGNAAAGRLVVPGHLIAPGAVRSGARAGDRLTGIGEAAGSPVTSRRTDPDWFTALTDAFGSTHVARAGD